MASSEISTRCRTIVERVETLAALTEDAPGTLTRTFLTDACRKTNEQIRSWLADSPLQAGIDNIGNVRVRHRRHDRNRQSIVIGSHLDTVINGGKYDGILGFLLGLDQLEHRQADYARLKYNLDVIGFANEEAVRYKSEYLGSKAVAGRFDAACLDEKDCDGISLREAIRQFGGNADNIPEDRLTAQEVYCYFEPHIEQGPVLEVNGLPVGVVTAIAGKRKFKLRVKGEAGHAGTLPMDLRKDALALSARIVSAIEQIATDSAGGIVATVGDMEIRPGASNVVPAECLLTVDIRAQNDQAMDRHYRAIIATAQGLAAARNMQVAVEGLQENSATPCDAGLQKVLGTAIERAGLEAASLLSGAGHDAVVMSTLSPVAMLFIRCHKGISHNPAEDVAQDDIEVAIKVMDNFIEAL